MSRGVGPLLVVIGVLIVVVGLLAWTGGLSWFGRLPGDFRIKGGRTTVFAPITSMLLVSLLLSVLLTLLRR